jgi:hypothetical protein
MLSHIFWGLVGMFVGVSCTYLPVRLGRRI